MGRGGGECATALRLNNELMKQRFQRVATRSSAGLFSLVRGLLTAVGLSSSTDPTSGGSNLDRRRSRSPIDVVVGRRAARRQLLLADDSSDT